MHTHLRMLQKYFMIQRMCSRVMAKNVFNKRVSSIVKMEGYGQNMALFYQIWRIPAPHRHLMGKYPVHLPALSGQVRVHIALQGDVGVGVSQQFAEGLYITPRLQTGGSKGVSQRVRTYLPDGRLFQIRLDAFPITAGLCRFGFITR